MAFLLETKIRYFIIMRSDAGPPIKSDSLSHKSSQHNSPLPVGDGNIKILIRVKKHIIQHKISSIPATSTTSTS